MTKILEPLSDEIKAMENLVKTLTSRSEDDIFLDTSSAVSFCYGLPERFAVLHLGSENKQIDTYSILITWAREYDESIKIILNSDINDDDCNLTQYFTVELPNGSFDVEMFVDYVDYGGLIIVNDIRTFEVPVLLETINDDEESAEAALCIAHLKQNYAEEVEEADLEELYPEDISYILQDIMQLNYPHKPELLYSYMKDWYRYNIGELMEE